MKKIFSCRFTVLSAIVILSHGISYGDATIYNCLDSHIYLSVSDGPSNRLESGESTSVRTSSGSFTLEASPHDGIYYTVVSATDGQNEVFSDNGTYYLSELPEKNDYYALFDTDQCSASNIVKKKNSAAINAKDVQTAKAPLKK